MYVVPDANILFDDPVLVREPASTVLDLLAPARAQLVLSPVVYAEIRRQRTDKIRDLADEAIARIKKIERLAGSTSNGLVPQIEAKVVQAAELWDVRWAELRANHQIEVAGWPDTDVQQLVERELARRRPFMDKDAGTIGHRDTVIWLGVLELAGECVDDEEVVFLTNDKGFLETNGLHADLTEDLERAGLSDRVRLVTSWQALSAVLHEAAATSGWESWRASAIYEALREELQDLEAADFAPQWDPRDGGLATPRFDIGLPASGHEWTLSHIDGPHDLTFDEVPHGIRTVTCSFSAEMSMSGFMDKFEWYADDHPALDLWDADWNSHLVAVESDQQVRFSARLQLDDVDEQVDDVQIVDVTGHAEPGGVTIE